MSASKPVIALTLEEPLTLADVTRWANIAQRIGIPKDSPLEIERHPYRRLTVRAYPFVAAPAGMSRDPETGRFTSAGSA